MKAAHLARLALIGGKPRPAVLPASPGHPVPLPDARSVFQCFSWGRVGASTPHTCAPCGTDRVLPDRVRAGEAKAFEALIHKNYRFFFRVAFRWPGNRSDAEDISQTVCTRLSGRIRSFDGRAAFSSWFYRVTLNAVREFQRATQRRGQLAGAVQHLGDDLQAPDQEMALHIADIWRLLRQLPQKQRDAVMLVYAEKLSEAEAARIMGCEEPPLTWPVCFFRARAKLPARDAFYGVNKYGDHHAARSRPDRHLTRAGPASHPGRGIAARARRSQLLGPRVNRHSVLPGPLSQARGVPDRHRWYQGPSAFA